MSQSQPSLSNHLSRRHFLAFTSTTLGLSLVPSAFAFTGGTHKLVFVILRGGMDGLSALIPTSPIIEALRAGILPSPEARLALTSDFALHPALPGLAELYRNQQLAFVHACSSAYRERSHFDGQDFLETLSPTPARDGWLNRAIGLLGSQSIGIGIGPSLPLVLSGPAPAGNWSPRVFDTVSDDLLDRLGNLYGPDPLFSETLADARALSEIVDAGGDRVRGGPEAQYSAAMAAAGRLIAGAGANVGVVSLDGWDTHANQAGALATRFAALDTGLAALRGELGSDWERTVVLIASEFGRTARANGTQGSDHGTGGLVILAGGAVNGGHVHGEWPGIGPGELYQDRDLAPANAFEAIAKGVLRDHLGLDPSDLDRIVLPDSAPALNGLIRI